MESSNNPWAVRYEPGFSYFENVQFFAQKNHISQDTEMVFQKCSFGLMQIMGGTARWLGFDGMLSELLRPELSVHYGAKLLSQKLIKHGTYEAAISAYNAGTPKKESERFTNQAYVDRVLAAQARLRDA